MPSLTPLMLLSLLEADRAPAILDVRSAAEFRRGHVPQARHVPFWRILGRAPAWLSPDAAVVLYCGHGPRACVAAWALRRRGFRHVQLLRGHMAGWRGAGLPEKTD